MGRAMRVIRIASFSVLQRRMSFAASRVFACPPHAASDAASPPTATETIRSCWKCGAKVPASDLFCPSSSCNVVQLLKLNETNLFRLFGLPETYFIDEKKLEQAFKQLQSKLHPDKVAAKAREEIDISTESSSATNVAYEILKKPVSRAEYMIQRVFGQKLQEERTIADPQLMAEMFELQESVDDETEPVALQDIRSKLQRRIEAEKDRFAKALEKKDKAEAESCTVRMKYYEKTIGDIDSKLDR